MQFDARLTADAAALAREHRDTLRRLPATVHAFILVELQKWPLLFEPERRYQRALLGHLSQARPETLTELTAGIRRVEAEAGLNRIDDGDPARFQDQAQSALRARSLAPAWRREIDQFFQQIDPALESQLYPADAPRRLVVQLYGSGIAVQPKALWRRFKGTGTRIPLTLDGVSGADGFLRTLLGAAPGGDGGSSLFTRSPAPLAPLEAWIVESHDGLHRVMQGGPAGAPASPLTALSYDRLRPYRDQLTRALYGKIQTGVESPQAFAAYARSLKLAPDDRLFPHAAELVQAFVREVLLTGNGTLFVNNTFVEWAAVQALRRAQPRLLLARYGVRDRLKPFSSLLLFSEARRSDQIPIVDDPVGSFVDVEQLSYYVWLNAEKSPAYRRKTLYLFLAEDIEDMLAIRSDRPGVTDALPAVTLPDVCATMAHWMGLPAPAGSGRPITPLIS